MANANVRRYGSLFLPINGYRINIFVLIECVIIMSSHLLLRLRLSGYTLTAKLTRSTVFVPPTVRFLAWSMVTPSVEAADVKNFCSDDCAVTASCTVSDWRMNNTATRAKSRAWSETEKVDVAAAEVAVLVAVSVAVVSVPTVVVAVAVAVALAVSVVAKMVEKLPVLSGSVRVLTMMDASVAAESRVKVMATPDIIVTVTGTAAAASTTLASTSPSKTAAELVVVVVVRVDDPSKVTSAFSATHERLAELNLERIVVAERGTEKLVCPSCTRRGMA
jgi:hypothetical protein